MDAAQPSLLASSSSLSKASSQQTKALADMMALELTPMSTGECRSYTQGSDRTACAQLEAHFDAEVQKPDSFDDTMAVPLDSAVNMQAYASTTLSTTSPSAITLPPVQGADLTSRRQPSSSSATPQASTSAKRTRRSLIGKFNAIACNKKPPMGSSAGDTGVTPLDLMTDDENDDKVDNSTTQRLATLAPAASVCASPQATSSIPTSTTLSASSTMTETSPCLTTLNWRKLKPVERFGPHLKARHIETEQVYFLKATTINVNGLPPAALRETGLLQRFSHPNIMPLLGVRSNLQVYEMALPFVADTLGDVIANQRLLGDEIHPNWSATCQRLLVQLVAAVSHVHAHGHVHGNITPSQIRVLPSQQLLLTGFQHARLGLVPVASDRPRDYLPLDVLLGNEFITMEADVWSCGVIYLHMLAGRSVFREDSDIAQLMLMMATLGTPTENTWPGITAFPFYQTQFPRFTKRHWRHVLQTKLSQAQTSLIDAMLCLDPQHRPSAKQCIRLVAQSTTTD
eukprot:m.16607 g.16607  ORF g.16607 m.16607 type:complete len:513 (-) comp10589_c0_seq1:134-1672(-)